MRKSNLSNTVRKLEDSSWLAQTLKDKMDIEFETKGHTSRYNCLQTLRIIVQEADNAENSSIYYDTRNCKRGIIICDIPSLALEYGLDFDREGMRNKLRGLAERYKDDEGYYIVNVLTTHDLNSATINDISELLYQMQY